MRILIKGAGDIASGIAYRLQKSGFTVVMTDLPKPTAIRRTVCFSEAIVRGSTAIEGVTARFADGCGSVPAILRAGEIPVLADPEASCIEVLRPDAVIDAILAKRNIGTRITDAPCVVAVGPGFAAGTDCHAVVETMRGHTLGRVIYDGEAIPNTGVPGPIGGFSIERLLRAPCDGEFRAIKRIADTVARGDIVAYVGEEPIQAGIDGVLRGLLPDGAAVYKGMKSGDIDPRCEVEHCYRISDKALAVAGGVLEAVLALTKGDWQWTKASV